MDDAWALLGPALLAAAHFLVVRRFVYPRHWRERSDVRRLEVVVFVLLGSMVAIGVLIG